MKHDQTTTESSPSQEGSTLNDFLRGSFWSIAMRWGRRLIGLVSTIILARILTPEDFGIVAMGTLVLGFLSGFTELGVQMFLIREKSITDEHTNTAWTVRFLQHCVIAIFFVLIAGVAADFFNEAELKYVIYAMAVTTTISGLENIGIVFFRKNLQFAKDFQIELCRRLFRFLFVVTLALILRNYWALVFGSMLGAIASVALSYQMHPHRPRFTLSRFREFIHLSIAVIQLNIGKFLTSKFDVLVVGRLASTSYMGVYNVASELSSVFTREIIDPLGRGLFPNLAKLVHDPEKLQNAFIHVLGAAALVCFPLGIGLWSVAENFVLVLLGSQWENAVPIIKWLAIAGAFGSLSRLMTQHIFIVTGHERVSVLIMWLRLGILIPTVLIAGLYIGVEAIAPAIAFTPFVIFPTAVYLLCKTLNFRFLRIASVLWRPILSAILMALCVRHIDTSYTYNSLVMLIIEVCAGGIAYILTVYFLWFLSSQPMGSEHMVYQTIKKGFGAHK